MKYKKIIYTFITFMLIIALTTISIFSMKVKAVDFELINSKNSMDIYNDVKISLEKEFIGDNIFNINNKAVENAVSNAYISIVSVEKTYPSELCVKARLREVLFSFLVGSDVYYLDNELFVLEKAVNVSQNNSIEVSTVGLTVNLPNNLVGTKMNDEDFELLYKMLEFYNKFTNGNNIIKSIFVDNEGGKNRITFKMVEGVSIVIYSALSIDGEEILAGINYYLSLDAIRKLEGEIILQKDLDGNMKEPTHSPY